MRVGFAIWRSTTAARCRRVIDEGYCSGWLLGFGHRLAIVALLVLVGAAGAVLAGKGSPAETRGSAAQINSTVRTLTWSAIGVADLAIVVAALAIFRANRRVGRLWEIIGLMLFCLLLVHLAGYLLLNDYRWLFDARQYLLEHQVLREQ